MVTVEELQRSTAQVEIQRATINGEFQKFGHIRAKGYKKVIKIHFLKFATNFKQTKHVGNRGPTFCRL